MSDYVPPERGDFLDESHAVFFGDHVARYDFASNFVRGKRVVDAACGSGYGSLRLIHSGALTCTGIDLDTDSIARNRRIYGPQGVEFVQADCEQHSLSQYQPDVVVSFETIEHIKNPVLFLGQVRDSLGDDGLFIVSCPNNEDPGVNPFHLHTWDSVGFEAMLGEYFGEVLVLGQVQTPSSRVHQSFGRYVDQRIGILWNQPWTRAWRMVRRLLGRPAELPRPIRTGIVPGPGDWWFIPDVSDHAMALLALCRRPRRP